MKYCVCWIAQCDVQDVICNSDCGNTAEFVTLSTQTIWHATPSKHTNNCHSPFKLYDYCPVCANNSLRGFGICPCRTQIHGNRVWSDLQTNYYTIAHFTYMEYCKTLMTSLHYARLNVLYVVFAVARHMVLRVLVTRCYDANWTGKPPTCPHDSLAHKERR